MNDDEHSEKDSPTDQGRDERAQHRKRGLEPLYLQPAAACKRWGIGKTSLYKALNRTLPGCDSLPTILVVKFGAATLIHVPTGDAFFSMLPRYNSTPAHSSDTTCSQAQPSAEPLLPGISSPSAPQSSVRKRQGVDD